MTDTDTNMTTKDNSTKANTIDLKTFITYRLARLQSRLNAQAIRLLKQHCDLSLTEWRVLVVTNDQDAQTLSDLVRITSLDKGQLSRAVTLLVGKDYLQSVVNKNDQRQNILKPTPAGIALWHRMLPIMQARQRYLTSAVPPDDLATVFRVLDQIESATDSIPGDV